VAIVVLQFALRPLLTRSTAEQAGRAPPESVATTGAPAGPPAGSPAPPAAPLSASPSAAVPAPAPAPSLQAVSAALADVPCSALAPAIDGHAVRVQGYLARSVGQVRLKNALAALPGVARVDLALHEVDDDKCALIRVLGRYWVGQRMPGSGAGGGASIRLNRGGGKAGNSAGNGNDMREGDTLMVDVTTPNYQSYLAVDYFVLDGHVVHLLPNALQPENQAPPRYAVTVGSLDNWMIGAPFGTEMLVLVATPVPLFDGLRPDSEAAPDYLQALDHQLARISKSHGAGMIAVEFLQITTHPRR
jgi:hypothetical protein